MNRFSVTLSLSGLTALAGALFWVFVPPPVAVNAVIPSSDEAVARGEYLFSAGGCISCHKGEKRPESPSGGLALSTDFGVFYAPNITPDPVSGTGNWSGGDFINAVKYGRAPDGSYYFPAFPYRSYAGLSDEDVLNMAAYMLSLDAVDFRSPEPEPAPWLRRWMIAGWNRLADLSQPDRETFADETVARGAYLARNLGHCGECHTPRNGLGIPDWSREFGGSQLGDELIEPIDSEALAHWTAANFDLFLMLGMKPEGEFVGGDMNEVIEFNTSRLTDQDREALAAFFTRHRRPD